MLGVARHRHIGLVQTRHVKESLLPQWIHDQPNLGGRRLHPAVQGGPTVAGNAQVTLGGGNLSSNIVKSVVIDSNGVVTVSNPGPDNLALSITPSTGLFSGGFTNLDINKIEFFTGYLLQTNRS